MLALFEGWSILIFHLISSGAPPLLQVCLEAENVVVAEPDLLALLSEVVFAVELEAPALLSEVVRTAELEVAAAVLAELELAAAAVLAELEVAVLAAESDVVALAEPEAVFVSELQVSLDIAVAFVVLVLVSVVAAKTYSSERPRFLAFPSVDCFANSSSSVELVAEESVDSPTGARTNFYLCSILSNPGLHQNKNLEPFYNNANPGYNNASDTNGLPMDATTNRSRKTNLRQCRERHIHTCQAILSPAVVRQIRRAVANQR